MFPRCSLCTSGSYVIDVRIAPILIGAICIHLAPPFSRVAKTAGSRHVVIFHCGISYGSQRLVFRLSDWHFLCFGRVRDAVAVVRAEIAFPSR